MEHAEVNQSQLAEIAGISRSNISDIVVGRRGFSKGSIKRLCERFRLSADYFLD